MWFSLSRMSVSPQGLQDHIGYTAWASLRLIEAASKLSHEELTRDFQTADKTVLDTLLHVYFADRIWLARLKGEPFSGRPTESERSLDFLQSAWPDLYDHWRVWAASLTAESPAREVTYLDLKQNRYKQPLWQIVLHVVNHGTHHRGQAAGFMRSMGHAPPVIDLSAYFRGTR
jgi:uncharacterized damage-inducible protein DinB